MSVPRVESVNIGRLQPLTINGRIAHSGIFKQPVDGPVPVDELGLAGDVQADKRHHGGPDKALNVYPLEHYAHWRGQLQRELSPGAFGENLTISGLLEDEVAIGEVLGIGGSLFQVTQARQPCGTLAARHETPQLVKWVETSGRTGFYLRCLQAGTIAAGAQIERISRPATIISLAAAYRILRDKHDRDGAQRLLAVDALSDAWRAELLPRVRR